MMAIDWGSTARTAGLVLFTALVSAWMTASIKAYVDRARPVVLITGIRRGRLTDMAGRTVKIPDALAHKLHRSTWTPSLYGDVDVSKVQETADSLRSALAKASGSLAFLDQKILELADMESASAEAKIRYLESLAVPEFMMVDAAITGGLARNELELPLPTDDQLAQCERLVDYVESSEKERGYLLNLRSSWYAIHHNYPQDSPRLLPIAKALAYFHLPSIKALMEFAKRSIAELVATHADILREFEELQEAYAPIIVSIRVINRGRSAVVFSAWGLLEVSYRGLGGGSDNSIELVHSQRRTGLVVARSDTGSEELRTYLEQSNADPDPCYSVAPGASTQVTYRSRFPMGLIMTEAPSLLKAMDLEVFRCRAHIRRADSEQPRRAWVHTTPAVFGVKGEQFPEGEKQVALKAVLHQP
jgi:hypothetical protein